MSMDKKLFKWFAILVVQGKEFYVRDRIKNLNDDFVKEHLREVLLPTEKEIYEVRRKKVVRNIPIYPNYLFANTSSIDAVSTAIRDISYAIRILGDSNRSIAISEDEMEIVKAMAANQKIHSAFKYKIGDVIEIIGGHCKSLAGRVIDIPDVNCVKVEIQIFNRAIYSTIKLEDVKAA